MIRKLACFIILTVLTVVPVVAQDDTIGQWASDAQATSEFGSDNWSAMQATGEPDTFRCGDLVTAWASSGTTNPNEVLLVFYDIPVLPTQVNIYQTYNPGAITSLDLLPADGGDPIPVSDSADPGTDCPGVFSLNINWENPEPILGVAIHLDQRQVDSWNEIDAVELVGIPASDVDFSTNTSGDYSYDGAYGRSVNCTDGASFDNGVEVRIIQMRSGFTYTATAVGINGFDPVLAVLDDDGHGLCNDDDVNAAEYSAWLPTTGEISPSNRSSQVFFANNSNSAFADISLVVGGLNNQTGEFVLILEGMVLTDADGAGDAFAMQITPGMIASGVTPTVYQISVTNSFDPLIALIDSDYNFVRDDDKNYIACDNAGYDTCWGESSDMTGFFVSRSNDRQLGGGSYDAMLRMPVQAGYEYNFYNFLMRSSEMLTYGDYIVAFHMGIGA